MAGLALPRSYGTELVQLTTVQLTTSNNLVIVISFYFYFYLLF